MKQLSVIIPIYNVEPYVERCLRSLENQDIPSDNYEIICINDGSKDNSRDVVIRLQKEYDNIQLIDQQNQGVSRARNNGIGKASGKYLLFIDPDDYVDENSFSRILNMADQKEIQVSFLGFTILNEDGTIQKKIFNSDLADRVYSGSEAYILSRRKGTVDPDRTWAVLFRREFMDMHQLRYLPDVPYLEDGELIARILCMAERCTFNGSSFYLRTTRPGSATHSNLFYSEKANRGFILAAEKLMQFRQNNELSISQKNFLNQPIVKFVKLSINSCLDKESFKRYGTTVKRLKQAGLSRLPVKGCFRIYQCFGRAYNVSPFFGALVIIIYPGIERLFGSNRINQENL